MRNLKMTIAYDGFKYKGWQKQKDTDLTIQGKIEAVLSKMAGEDIQLVGCGRTDSGVHAENYIANFHTKCAFSTDTMLDYLYEYLPEDIGIKSITIRNGPKLTASRTFIAFNSFRVYEPTISTSLSVKPIISDLPGLPGLRTSKSCSKRPEALPPVPTPSRSTNPSACIYACHSLISTNNS